MVESAFGSLKVALDRLLAEKPAVPARQAGADLLASDPKTLLGSLLKFKDGAGLPRGAVRVGGTIISRLRRGRFG